MSEIQAWSERADSALKDVWRSLRDDASLAQMACAGAIVLFAYNAGLLNSGQMELWLRRFQECPGHDDEGGRDWCAYCGDMTKERP